MYGPTKYLKCIAQLNYLKCMAQLKYFKCTAQLKRILDTKCKKSTLLTLKTIIN